MIGIAAKRSPAEFFICQHVPTCIARPQKPPLYPWQATKHAWYLSLFFYKTTIWGQEILHLEVREF